MTPSSVLVDPPVRLRKYYTEAHFADAFCRDGQLRLRRVQFYRTIEDARRQDKDEGEGRLRIPGLVPVVNVSLTDGSFTDAESVDGHFNYAAILVTPTYLFCTADATVPARELVPEYGSEIVDIVEPKAFFRAFCVAAIQPRTPHADGREVHYVEGFPMRYDKDHVADRPEEQELRSRLAYGQKAASFGWQREYRFVVALSGSGDDAPEFIDLHVQSPDQYLARVAAGGF